MRTRIISLLIAAGLLLSTVSCSSVIKRYARIINKAGTSRSTAHNGENAGSDAQSEEDDAFEPGAYDDGDDAAVTTTTTSAPRKNVKDTEIVRVRDYIPDVEVEIMYATDRNFTGKVIYNFDDAWLRYGTVKKLKKAQEKLKKQGYYLKIWDSFRPVEAQWDLWNECPDPKYVSDPNKGYSSHSRGNAVDVTLVDKDAWGVDMPTGFDNFTKMADRNYSDVKNKEAVKNAKLLEKIMKECGFKAYSAQWWLYIDTKKYDVAEDFDPADFD